MIITVVVEPEPDKICGYLPNAVPRRPNFLDRGLLLPLADDVLPSIMVRVGEPGADPVSLRRQDRFEDGSTLASLHDA
jgi:hypothetical protein